MANPWEFVTSVGHCAGHFKNAAQSYVKRGPFLRKFELTWSLSFRIFNAREAWSRFLFIQQNFVVIFPLLIVTSGLYVYVSANSSYGQAAS